MNEFIFKKLTNQVMKMPNGMEDEYNYSSVSKQIIDENKRNLQGFFDSICKYFRNFNDTIEEKFDKFVEIPTERTHFTHKKKGDFNKLKTKISSSMKESSNNEKTTIFMQAKSHIITSDDYKINFKTCLSNQTETNILLLKQSFIYSEDNLDNPAFLLIFPPSFSSDLFRRFVYLESKPIGLKEFKHYHLDKRNLFFPYDYPSTKSYLTCLKTKVIMIYFMFRLKKD